MPGQKLTVREAASQLTLSIKHVYALLKSGEIPSLRMGGAIRVLESDVQAYMLRCYNGPADASPMAA